MGYKVVDGLAADGQSFQQNYKQLSTRRTSLLQEKVPIVIDTAKVRGITIGTPTLMMEFPKDYTVSSCNSWKITPDPNKTFNFVVDFNKMTLTANLTTNVTLCTSDMLPTEYYNLQGVRVQNPGPGIYIVRRGTKITKEVIR